MEIVFGSKEERLQRKMEKNNEKATKLMEKAQAYKREIFESQYFTERKEVYSIETFY